MDGYDLRLVWASKHCLLIKNIPQQRFLEGMIVIAASHSFTIDAGFQTSEYQIEVYTLKLVFQIVLCPAGNSNV